MHYNEITVGIVTFKSENVIFNCLKNIKKINKIIVFDNSNDKPLKNKILKQYPNIKVILSKKNLGYGVANNKIINKSKTPYVLIINPDVSLEKNCELNLLKSIKKLKNNFAIISPQSINYKNFGYFGKETFSKKKILKVDFVVGFAMLINKKKFKNIGMFDENIFLYQEEFDLCKRLKLANEKVFINKDSKVTHLGAKSTNIGFEFDKCRNWHFMWSQVYFDKKYSNIFKVYFKFTIILLLQVLKIFFYSIILNKKEVLKKSMRFSGTLNSLLGRKSWYRPKII